jgi:replicative DNA helicase
MHMAQDALVPLHSVEAEMCTLGSMILKEQAVEQVFAILKEDDFYLPSHRLIFSAIQDLAAHNRPVDLMSLKLTLSEKGHLMEVGGDNYLIHLMEFVPSAANATYYANQVLGRSLSRKLDSAGHDIIGVAREADMEADDKIDRAERLVFEVGNRRLGRDFVHIQPLTKDYMLEVDTLMEFNEPTLGLQSGFHDLDELTTGFYPGDFIIIAARPSMGKTSLVLRMAWHVAEREKQSVAIFSLEMGANQLTRRFASMISQISPGILKRPNLDMKDYKKLADACETMYDLPIYIDESSDISPLEMRGKCRRLKREHGLGLIVVDYLQLMQGSKKTENRTQEISEIARSLKSMAKELGVPVIALSQLNRGVESRDNKRPQLSDIRESGSIEAEADIVTFIYRDDYYKDREHPDEANTDPYRVEVAELLIAKHRNGPTGTVKLGFIPGYAKFENLKEGSY